MKQPACDLFDSCCIRPTVEDLHDALAALLMNAAFRAIQARGVFHLALSGGSTPEPFFVHLVIDLRFRAIPWEYTHLWQVDERRVPEDDPQRNWKMIHETLADHVPAKTRQRHPMPVLDPDPAGRYEAELWQQVAAGEVGGRKLPRLDFILLGMGGDGHTASLFPGSPALQEHQKLVAINAGPKVTPPDRLTLTYPLLNAARQAAVLVTGESKRATLNRIAAQIRTQGRDPQTYPITGLDLADGELTWFADQAAGADLA